MFIGGGGAGGLLFGFENGLDASFGQDGRNGNGMNNGGGINGQGGEIPDITIYGSHYAAAGGGLFSGGDDGNVPESCFTALERATGGEAILDSPFGGLGGNGGGRLGEPDFLSAGGFGAGGGGYSGCTAEVAAGGCMCIFVFNIYTYIYI